MKNGERKGIFWWVLPIHSHSLSLVTCSFFLVFPAKCSFPKGTLQTVAAYDPAYRGFWELLCLGAAPDDDEDSDSYQSQPVHRAASSSAPPSQAHRARTAQRVHTVITARDGHTLLGSVSSSSSSISDSGELEAAEEDGIFLAPQQAGAMDFFRRKHVQII